MSSGMLREHARPKRLQTTCPRAPLQWIAMSARQTVWLLGVEGVPSSCDPTTACDAATSVATPLMGVLVSSAFAVDRDECSNCLPNKAVCPDSLTHCSKGEGTATDEHAHSEHAHGLRQMDTPMACDAAISVATPLMEDVLGSSAPAVDRDGCSGQSASLSGTPPLEGVLAICSTLWRAMQ